ncbi:hypothetical protein ADIS_1526 [Lunatimonas lonarensis]|uniref:Uncharacterized protein n=1 Tax=Lunatimonas lonarensis TaxID=1232681 RepID=R7ZV77_9BACT|nr:hypothetical protein ADIS_1526 [Lunatimonas lonarensis]
MNRTAGFRYPKGIDRCFFRIVGFFSICKEGEVAHTRILFFVFAYD